jgi:uncharacterized protein YndB with AHSA1/START domain
MGVGRAVGAGNQGTADREIVLTREFDAPRELVFKAWTDPMHIAQWWGPRGFTTTIYEMDVRPGGVWRFVMHGPDGRDYQNRIVYDEIVRPELLAYTHIGEGEDNVHFQATVTFTETGPKTSVTLRLIFPTAAERDRVVNEYGAIEGGNQTLERLGHYLSQVPVPRAQSAKDAFVLTRVFDAPRNLIFKAWTDPKELKRWWGPAGCTVGTCKVDLRPSGMCLYSLEMPHGSALWGRFIYREITPPERLVFVSSFSDEKGGLTRAPFSGRWPLEIFNTITFAENEGKTTLTLLATPINAIEEERQTFADAMGSLRQGFGGTLDKLVKYLEEV